MAWTDAWLTDRIVASEVRSGGERWRRATGGREPPLRQANMTGDRRPHQRIRRTLTASGQSGAEELCDLGLRDFPQGVAWQRAHAPQGPRDLVGREPLPGPTLQRGQGQLPIPPPLDGGADPLAPLGVLDAHD